MNKNLWIRALFLLIGVLCYGTAMAVNITGTVWVDANSDGTVDAGETSTNFGGTMYVNVVNNTTGAIIASTQVGPAGGYSFTGLPNNLAGHKLVLTNTATNPKGNRIPGVYYTAEDVVENVGYAGYAFPCAVKLPSKPVDAFNFRKSKISWLSMKLSFEISHAAPTAQKFWNFFEYSLLIWLAPSLRKLPLR